MDFSNYIGFRFEDIKSLLDEKSIPYELIEVWDSKRTKIGNDLRIINVKTDEKLIIYVSYF